MENKTRNKRRDYGPILCPTCPYTNELVKLQQHSFVLNLNLCDEKGQKLLWLLVMSIKREVVIIKPNSGMPTSNLYSMESRFLEVSIFCNSLYNPSLLSFPSAQSTGCNFPPFLELTIFQPIFVSLRGLKINIPV